MWNFIMRNDLNINMWYGKHQNSKCKMRILFQNKLRSKNKSFHFRCFKLKYFVIVTTKFNSKLNNMRVFAIHRDYVEYGSLSKTFNTSRTWHIKRNLNRKTIHNLKKLWHHWTYYNLSEAMRFSVFFVDFLKKKYTKIHWCSRWIAPIFFDHVGCFFRNHIDGCVWMTGNNSWHCNKWSQMRFKWIFKLTQLNFEW